MAFVSACRSLTHSLPFVFYLPALCLHSACTLPALISSPPLSRLHQSSGLASSGFSSTGPWVEVWTALDETLRTQRLAELADQGLANTIWAFATADHTAEELFEATSHRVVDSIRSFSPQGLANTAWAFATAGDSSPQLFGALVKELQRRDLGDFKSQELCNMLWSFASCGVEDVRRAARSLRQAALATALPLTLLTRPSRLFVRICRPPRSHPPPRSLPLSSTWRRLR